MGETIKELLEMNARWLRQAERLLESIGDAEYSAMPKGFAPHRAGGHMRHILEFYECFLLGIRGGAIDYDARRRDLSVERDRRAALSRIHEITEAFESPAVPAEDREVQVRMEAGEALLRSSIARELQVLSSHTVHHFALMALVLRLLGVEVDAAFGMAPSTLRHMESRRPEAA